ncbi:MAG: hypothetical protein ABL986_18700 [Vicinamibacterales bacterium]
MLPLLAHPGLLRGEATTPGVIITGNELIYFGIPPDRFAEQHSASGLSQTDDVDATAFARMIAKIAFCYAWSMFPPLRRLEVSVLPFILGNRDDGGEWIGSSVFEHQSQKDGANVTLALVRRTFEFQGEVRTAATVQVKLFAQSGATGYEVVIYQCAGNLGNTIWTG